MLFFQFSFSHQLNQNNNNYLKFLGVVEATFETTDLQCFDSADSGSVTITATSGTTPYEYSVIMITFLLKLFFLTLLLLD